MLGSVMKQFISFSAKTCAFSWLAWLPVVILGFHTVDSPTGAILFMIGGFGPSVVGAVRIIRSGTDGWRTLASRVVSPRRLGTANAIVALLFYPVAFAIGAGIVGLTGGSTPGMQGLRDLAAGLRPAIGDTALVLVLGPISEEVGWRGFGLEALQRAYTPLASSLLIGVVWWAWHLPLFLMEGTLHASQGLFSGFTVGYLFTVVAYSVVFTLLYNRSERSILVAILAHFSVNFTISAAVPFGGGVFVAVTLVLLTGGGVLYATDRRLGYRD